MALSSATFDDGSPLEIEGASDWFVVQDTEEVVTILREITPDESPDPTTLPADHDKITVFWADAVNVAPGWIVGSTGPCALTHDLGQLTVPAVTFDPAQPRDLSSRELHLLVTEQTCNSGEDAEGRIEPVSVDEKSDRIALVLGVRPRAGDQNCPTNPATPYTVTLTEPLGDRLVVNAALQREPALVDG